jgi:hypothetical protein
MCKGDRDLWRGRVGSSDMPCPLQPFAFVLVAEPVGNFTLPLLVRLIGNPLNPPVS